VAVGNRAGMLRSYPSSSGRNLGRVMLLPKLTRAREACSESVGGRKNGRLPDTGEEVEAVLHQGAGIVKTSSTLAADQSR